jgi:hypothetical protein
MLLGSTKYMVAKLRFQRSARGLVALKRGDHMLSAEAPRFFRSPMQPHSRIPGQDDLLHPRLVR